MDRSVYDTGDAYGTFTEQSVKTPGFWSRDWDREPLPLNPYLWHRRDCKDPKVPTYNGLQGCRNAFGPAQCLTTWSTGVLTLTAGPTYKTGLESFASVERVASNKCLNHVRDQEIDLGVSLGEYRETASFVASAMRKTARSFMQFKRGNVSGAMRTLTGEANDAWRDIPGVASNAWLAYSYGLSPLVKDVYDSVDLYQRRYERLVTIPIARGSHKAIVNATVTHSSGKYSAQIASHISSRCVVEFDVENPLLRTLDQLGVINPLSVAWELVPFSFVVDWFIPIGSFISGIVPPQGVKFRRGYVTTKASGVILNKTTIPPAGPLGYVATSEQTEVFKRRTVLTNFPRYHLVVPDLSLQKGQIASALALMTQALIKP